MKMTRILTLLLLCAVCVACGNKGPLVRPDKAADAPVEQPADKTSTTPASQ